MKDIKLIAKKRTLKGSANSRRIRGAGALPSIVYGGENSPVLVEVNIHDFEQILHHHASESLIVEIELEGEGRVPVLVKEVQHHPVTSALLHVDLMRVTAHKPIHVDIQIKLVGEAAGVRTGGSLDHIMHSIGAECLPDDLVDAFEIDVTGLEIGQVLHVSDLRLGSQFKLFAEPEAIVATVSVPKTETDEQTETEETISSEPEIIAEKKKQQ